MTPTELSKAITSVKAIELKGSKYRINIVFGDGTACTIKQKSTRAPSMVQLYDTRANGNSHGGPGQFFTFSKTVDSWLKDKHLKSYPVTVVEA